MKTDFDKKEIILGLLKIFEFETEHIEDDRSFDHEYGFREDVRYYYDKYIYIDKKTLNNYLINLKKEYEIKDLDEDELTTYVTTINKEVA